MAIVVGSGAGGGTIAKELAAAGHDVLLIEKGPAIEERHAHRHYANIDAGVKVMRTCCLGGTTLVSAGNGMRCLERELRELGIDLAREFAKAEEELGVRELPDDLLGEGTRRLMSAARQLGHPVRKMPKFIDPDKCVSDGLCAFGCPAAAKWSAVRFVKEAEEHGARVITERAVDAILTRHGEVSGVRCRRWEAADDLVVLAAGALETPRLLGRLGLPTSPLFVDTFATIGGVCPGAGFHRDVPMGAFVSYSGGLVLPHYSRQLVALLQDRGHPVGPADVLGMMVKIRDQDAGEVGETVLKGVTVRDAELLIEGGAIAGAILERAGADPGTFVTAPLRGSHPGGTARIGVSVNTDLETEVSGLYVADASVLPAAPAAPPILTIVALAKYAAGRMGR
ncbi:MAG: FAD-dependent oxidoreductase [Methanomicrobiaceae archaeon]|uniref:4Fe-4S ferredoxin-type domain-containing protein n=1 Tax=hydrocarbon metagenome TaxID=938273 RepID=A0A0W8FJN2_9ZZZZ|nr:FAD-dependent oxidoreductase [Methanomicrobiaceae archaeon]MDD5420133.1 FAD-dependent oxidoreductase [Methanomicrobiaceae archaeon]